jgi:Family of unknown function (DUF5723)
MSKINFTLFFLFSAVLLSAQTNFPLAFQASVVQQGFVNPALSPEKGTIIISLPSAYADLAHTGMIFSNIIDTDNRAKKVVDFEKILSAAQEDNHLRVSTGIETIGCWKKMPNFTIGAYHAFRSETAINYEKATIDLLWRGNAPYIGSEVNIAPSFQQTDFSEFGFSVSKTIGKWSAGGRAKLLFGIRDASAQNAKASLTTSNDIYQLLLNTDYRINATGNFLTQKDAFNFQVGKAFTYSASDIVSNNVGAALDLGATYRPNERTILGVSAVNLLSGIQWKRDAQNFISQGTYEYKGENLNFVKIFEDNTIILTQKLDTLKNVFGFKATNASYTSALPMRAYLTAQYQVSDFWKVNGLFAIERFRGYTLPSLMVGATAQLSKNLDLGATYCVRNNSFTNIGANVSYQLSKFQIFAASDNIPALFNPLGNRTVSARLGMNLVW